MVPSRSAVVLLTLAAAATVCAEDTRPNILLIFGDDHAYQAISAYGSRINQTPHIDQLALGGMRFDRCYVTNSICAPSRATVLTGKYSHRNGVYINGNAFDTAQPTFPALLRGAGYQTALIGKWHLIAEPTFFDHYQMLIDQGPYYNPPMIENGAPTHYTGYTAEIITDQAIAWLREGRDKSRPFMLMYQHKGPHREWDPGPKYLNLYDDVAIPEPATLFEDYALRGTAVRQQDMTIAESLWERDLKLIPPRNLNADQLATWNAAYGPHNLAFRNAMLTGDALVRWKYQRYIKDYLRCVAAVDDQIGRVLKFLDESGLAQNTVVVFNSDQGFYLGEHGWFDKRFMYEQSLRTPLLIRWPGVIDANAVCDAIVSNLDFAPTFLEIAGLTPPDDMQGRSIVPLLRGQAPPDWRRTFYYHYYEFPGAHCVRRHYGVTDGRLKLIHFYEPDVNEWELYDLYADPNEQTNLYTNSVYAKAKERLQAELLRLRGELGVPEVDPPAAGDYAPTFRTRTRSGP